MAHLRVCGPGRCLTWHTRAWPNPCAQPTRARGTSGTRAAAPSAMSLRGTRRRRQSARRTSARGRPRLVVPCHWRNGGPITLASDTTGDRVASFSERLARRAIPERIGQRIDVRALRLGRSDGSPRSINLSHYRSVRSEGAVCSQTQPVGFLATTVRRREAAVSNLGVCLMRYARPFG
jgi:hypothetical protein